MTNKSLLISPSILFLVISILFVLTINPLVAIFHSKYDELNYSYIKKTDKFASISKNGVWLKQDNDEKKVSSILNSKTIEQEQYEITTGMAGGTQECHHMECTNCKVEFCWTCMKPYTGTNYYHTECPISDCTIMFKDDIPTVIRLPLGTGEEMVVSKQIAEPMHWIMHPAQTFLNKSSTLPKVDLVL